MFERVNQELKIESLRLKVDSMNKAGNEPVAFDSSSSATLATGQQQPTTAKMTFRDIMKGGFRENFCLVNQEVYPVFIKLRVTDLIKNFSSTVCTRSDGRSSCRMNQCYCMVSSDIGIRIYEKNGVHSFHQFGNYIIGNVLEQPTDSLTRVTIELNNSMDSIRRIYCPCRLHYCPHAFAVLNFRLKAPKFYGTKLPIAILDESITPSELTKFYGYMIENARSLPIIRDYQNKSNGILNANEMTGMPAELGPLKDSFIYGYCHKSLLPVDSAITEEQARAKKWIGDIYRSRGTLQPSSSAVGIGGGGGGGLVLKSNSSSGAPLSNPIGVGKNPMPQSAPVTAAQSMGLVTTVQSSGANPSSNPLNSANIGNNGQLVSQQHSNNNMIYTANMNPLNGSSSMPNFYHTMPPKLNNNPSGKENVKNQSYRKQSMSNQENKNPLGKQSSNNNNNMGMNGHRNQNYQGAGSVSSTSSSGMHQQQQQQPIQYIKYAPPPTDLMSSHGGSGGGGGMNYNPNTPGAYNQALMYQQQQANAAAATQLSNQNPNVKTYVTASSMPMRVNKNLLNAANQ